MAPASLITTGARITERSARPLVPAMADHSASGRRQTGFTLIEVMIAVAIIGIIAALAYPSYQNQVERGRLADGRAALVDTAQQLERCYSARASYQGCLGDTDNNAFSRNSDSDLYEVTFTTSNNGNAYVARAARIRLQDRNRCGTLTLDNAGRRGLEGADSGMTVEDCW